MPPAFPPAPARTPVNPKVLTAAVAADLAALPECQERMALDPQGRLVIAIANSLTALGRKPLAARPAVHIPAALAALLSCMLASCAGAPGHSGAIATLWAALIGGGVGICLIRDGLRPGPRKRRRATPPPAPPAPAHWRRFIERQQKRRKRRPLPPALPHIDPP